MKKIVAIHQPNFFPWLAYFHKIKQCDCFIILDDVQFQKSSGTWSNRVKILVSGKESWLTLPISRNYNGYKNINEMFFKDNENKLDLLRKIKFNYRKADFYNDGLKIIEPLILFEEQSISLYNLNAITNLCSHLGINSKKIITSSSLSHNGSSNELLISLVKQCDGDTYLCGNGSLGYLDTKIFTKNAIAITWQEFQAKIYKQQMTSIFIPGMSIIDGLMNIGVKGIIDILDRNSDDY